ncbi:MAG: PKD domain-containing protein, partial [Marinilabiliaceae bacterium]|nr:PKD domain-containing protein [Marinilabiliaceae bacterium]
DSEGATAWEWDFGNGNLSTLQNPKANYTSPGKYTVKLTINGSVTVEKKEYIKVYNNPTPDFSSDLTTGCVPLQVQFQDKTLAADGEIESWVWFLDGASISEENPNHTFNEPGSYKISLMATDEHGCYGNASKAKYITVSKVPEINFKITGDTPCELPYQPIIKNTTTVKDVDEPFVYINNWEWKINDKVVSKEQELDHRFEKNGKYTISLSAQMGACTDSLRVEDAIVLSVDALDYSIEQEGPGLKDNISFSVRNQNVSYVEWDLGDGYKTNEKQFNYCYADSGKYEVSITAILNNGCHLFRTEKVGVLPSPLASFTMEQQNICKPPFIVKFTNTSKMTEKVLWDFGDGRSSDSDTTVMHTFNSTGEFSVQLIAYGKGEPDTLTKVLSLYPPAGIPILTDRKKGCIPLNVQFNTSAPLKNMQWNFGDGEESALQAPKHTFNKEGNYKVRLTYINEQDCPVSSTIEISGGDKPIVNFEISQTDSCNRSPIELINHSSNYQSEEWHIGNYSESFYAYEAGSYGFHFYSPGHKPVELQLDNYGCTAALRKENAIYIKPPVASFYMEDPICEVPAQSNITNYAQQYDEIAWNFGDGHQQNSTPQYHIYEDTGNFNAYQTVVNHATGCRDYAIQPVHVSVTEPAFDIIGKKVGCLPHAVSFIDKSTTTGRIYRWHWDFGDGTIETTTTGEVSHVYTIPGEFDVKLTVEEFYGCRETVVKENAVTVNYVNAKIGFIKDTVCEGETFELKDISHSNSNIVDRRWLFSSGQTETSEVVKHAYTFPGNQEAILFVTDENGCTNSDTLDMTVPVAQALFILGDYACTDNELQVQNISLGEELNYVWNFGDGGSSVEKEPKYIYSKDGSYDVSLMVTNKQGCSGSSTQSVNAVTPVVDFDAYKTELGCARNALPAVFYDHSSADINGWHWDFGDGEGGVSQNKDPQYLYTLPGYYDVTLTVTSKGGCTRELIKKDFIHLTGPVGSIKTDVSAGCVPLTVNYTTDTDISNHISWDVGDGTNSYDNQLDFSHTYNESRSFFPSIILTDKDGCTMEYDGDPIIVDSYPELSFTADNTKLCEGSSLNFDGNINLKTSQLSQISEIIWDFGDSRHSSHTTSPSHTYYAPGTYDVELHVKTSIGCSATLKQEDFITVFPSTLKAAFSASKEKACLGESILFTNESQSDHPIIQERWDLNTDEFAAVSPLTYTYKEGGVFEAKLTVTDQKGCIDSTTTHIQISHVDASFIVDPVSGYAPLNAEFTEQASSDSELVSWKWDFGDHTTSNERNPKHSFAGDTDQSTYYVSLTVTDDSKCSATASDTVYAVNYPPLALNDTVNVQEDNVVYGNLAGNDSEPDGQPLLYNPVPLIAPAYGIVSIQEDGMFMYTPDQNYFGSDVFEYRVCDDGIPEMCASAKVYIEVLPVDDLPPVAMPDRFEVNEKETLVGTSIMLNDIDHEGMGLNVQHDSPVSVALHGEMVLNTDGTFSYTPDNTYVGQDSVKYIIFDKGLPSQRDSAWIVIDVRQVEEPPVAVADTFSINEDTPLALLNLAGNDTDPENNIDSKTVKMVGSVSNGGITNTDGEWVFTPEKDFNGTLRLSYSVSDMTFLTDTGEVVIQVGPVNDPPSAVTDSFVGFEQRSQQLNVIVNDTDIDGNLKDSIKILTGPLHGACTTPEHGRFMYTPQTGFFGSDSLRYEVFDSNELSDAAWVHIDIEKNRPPVAGDDHVTGYEDVPLEVAILSNDSDPDNNLDASSFKLLSADVSDDIAFDAKNGVLTYYSTENYIGPEVLSYEICDSLLLCSQAKVFINLQQSFDDAPITAPDTVWVIQSLSDTANVAANDTDPENDLDKESVYVVTDPGSHPDITVLEEGRILVDYVANPGYIGNDSLVYQICDLRNNCSEGKLYIMVRPYKESIFIPQAITPNGDGKNDRFEITHIDRFPGNQLYVYNRWEQEVYSKKGYANTWDGTFNNKPLPDGTYYYLLYLLDGDDPIKGFVYISR